MATSPDQLTDQIAATRGRMGGTIDEMQGRVSPRQAWERREPEVRSSLQRMKDTVMGTAHDASEQASGGVTAVTDRVRAGTDGNPLAAGIIAFGAGLLAGSIMPSSPTERRIVGELQDEMEEPIRAAMAESGEEIRGRVGDRVHEAVDATKGSAAEAADHVTDSAKNAAADVRDESRRAAEDVRRDVEGT